MSDTQRERMAGETIEQRQVRLQSISKRQQGLRSGEQPPKLFKQRSYMPKLMRTRTQHISACATKKWASCTLSQQIGCIK